MIDWLAVILLVFFGLAFIIAEIIFVPGTTILGFMGLLFTVAGVVISYTIFGAGIGTIVLAITLIVTLSVFIYSFRTGVWEKFALKDVNKSKFNEGSLETLQVGEEGTTLSSLRPVGKAEFKDVVFEVTTLGQFLSSDTPVRIVTIRNNKIIVEPVN